MALDIQFTLIPIENEISREEIDAKVLSDANKKQAYTNDLVALITFDARTQRIILTASDKLYPFFVQLYPTMQQVSSFCDVAEMMVTVKDMFLKDGILDDRIKELAGDSLNIDDVVGDNKLIELIESKIKSSVEILGQQTSELIESKLLTNTEIFEQKKAETETFINNYFNASDAENTAKTNQFFSEKQTAFDAYIAEKENESKLAIDDYFVSKKSEYETFLDEEARISKENLNAELEQMKADYKAYLTAETDISQETITKSLNDLREELEAKLTDLYNTLQLPVDLHKLTEYFLNTGVLNQLPYINRDGEEYTFNTSVFNDNYVNAEGEANNAIDIIQQDIEYLKTK